MGLFEIKISNSPIKNELLLIGIKTVNLLSLTSVVRIHHPPPEKSTHLSTKTMCAFFNEICPAGKRNSCAVKYLLRKCEIFADANVGKFHFTSNRAVGDVRYFTMRNSTLFHVLRKQNISLQPQAMHHLTNKRFRDIITENEELRL